MEEPKPANENAGLSTGGLQCPQCGAARLETTDYCRVCGRNPYVSGALSEPPRAPVWALALVALICFAIIGAIGWLMYWAVVRVN